MPSPTTFTAHRPHRRRGTAMLITMLVTTAAVAVLFMASDRMRGNAVMVDLANDRLRASLAAETIAALIEAKLVGHAAEVESLTTNLDDHPAAWWNLTGCSYSVGGTQIIPERGLWINGCVVRWRLEPVKIAAVIDAHSTAPEATYTVNREVDPSRLAQRDSEARAASEGGTLLPGNPPFFHYRIVAEAYALKNAADVTAAPWSQPGQHTVSAQVQRVVQLNLINLFDFAVFYGAHGETGDLEFEPDADTVMNASMHSNGAIYLGGTGATFKTRNYKQSASDGGTITMGNRSDKVQISGVMGVFRLRKAANVFFASASGNDEPTVLSPLEVPRPGRPVKKAKHVSVMSGSLDLNGGDGDPATEKVSLNGEKFTYLRDSRSDWSLPENRVDPYIKDAKSGGVAITSLASIPEFAGYPLEPQRLVGEQIPLYRTVDGDRFTVNPGREPARPLYYTSTGDLTTDRATGVRTVYATDMPLFRFSDAAGKTYEDVWPSQPVGPLSAALAPAGVPPVLDAPLGATPAEPHHTWLPAVPVPGAPGVVLGYYLEKSLFGTAGATTTGLTIRERGRQNSTFHWARTGETATTASGLPGQDLPVPADYADAASWIRAQVAWLKSNYAVYLGRGVDGRPRDITDEFFDFAAGTAEAAGDPALLVAGQGRFVNRREAHWLDDHGYFSAAAAHGPAGEDSARTLRACPFTLHLAQVCSFLRAASPTFGGLAPGTQFNGLVYLHRTPRLGQVAGNEGTYDPLAPLRYHPVSDPVPLAPDAISNTAHEFLVVGSLMPDATPAVGSPGSWVLYPLQLPVRIDQAAAIDWGGTRPGGGVQGLTIVTPDPCYIQGAFNTTPTSRGERPAGALFADSLTLLSNRWSDAENDQDADFSGPLPVAADTSLNLSLVLNNLPTDEDNVGAGGSGGLHNLVRYLEDWSGHTVTLQGSLVVLNRMRYSRAPLEEGTSYRLPQRRFIPDPGVFSESGKPPFAPSGIKVTRMVSTVSDTP